MRDAPATVFYDGHCGLCHRGVKFALRRDANGSRFRFAPLQGATLRERLDTESIAALPDSIVLLDADGTLRVKSDATLAILSRIGGAWAAWAKLGRCVPRVVRDGAYDAVARVRHRFFAKPVEACPVVPVEVRDRFLP